MHDEQDPVLRRLFAEQEKSLPSDDFMVKLGKRIDARERVRRGRRLLMISGCIVLAALGAPWVAQATSALIQLAAAGIGASDPLLQLPLTWLVLSATAVGCLPVIYLWRTGRW